MLDAEALLDSMAPIGWSLGLERMEALSDELGRPQDDFDSIHVVGTNGKSSVALMGAAIAGAHGVPAGCSISPHVERWSQRVFVGGHEIAPDRFAAAVARAAEAAASVSRGLPADRQVTQFELATAAAFVALAEAGVKLAMVEAGLGGRLDASNTINSRVTALTSVGLDHTEYLGGTEAEIAAEKLAVLRPGTTLVIGEVGDAVRDLAAAVASRLDCRLIDAGREAGPEYRPASPGPFQRRNFAVAKAAVGACLGELDEARTAAAAAGTVVSGRLEKVADDPPVYVDVAHNRAGAAALAEALPEVSEGRPVIALIAVLDDKDAAGMLAELAPALRHAVFTELPAELLAARGRPGTGSRPAAELLGLAERSGLAGERFTDPQQALAAARRLADSAGGVVLVAGSHFLASSIDTG